MDPFHITLTPADRERLGSGEVLGYDPSVVMLDEVETIQDHGGIDPAEWIKAQQVWIAALIDGFGSLDSAAQRLALRAERAIVWLALRRSGVDVAIGQLTYNRVGLIINFPTAGGQGKDPSTPPDASDTDANA
jgi:hypothetical protein